MRRVRRRQDHDARPPALACATVARRLGAPRDRLVEGAAAAEIPTRKKRRGGAPKSTASRRNPVRRLVCAFLELRSPICLEADRCGARGRRVIRGGSVDHTISIFERLRRRRAASEAFFRRFTDGFM
jgi:hypothetical protein